MSVTFTLIPLVVALTTSVSATTTGLLLSSVHVDENMLPPVPTIFNDEGLLLRTLKEHGLEAQKQGADNIIVKTDAGMLHYFKNDVNEPFQVEVKDARDIGVLLSSLDELENEYGRNVQKYTYDRIIEGLSEHGMSLASEEVDDDNSIILTLNVV